VLAAEGKGPAPLWVQVLLLAEDFGITPDEAMDVSEVWVKRWQWWRRAKIAAEDRE
jgi:hypothetical protein